ncbi:MAG: hypothetical protein PHS41_08865 [Victivallaceae bacterium]|nr:hypothetical protein [Victivallaceae bacterium]
MQLRGFVMALSLGILSAGSVLFAAPLPVASNRQQAVSGSPIERMDLKLQYVLPPVISFSNATSVVRNKKANSWLLLDLTFRTKMPSKGAGKLFMDQVEMESTVCFLTSENQRKSIVALTGKSKYWTVEINGAEQHMLMAVPAQLLNRYGAVNRGGRGTVFFAKVVLTAGGKTIGSVVACTDRTRKERETEMFFRQVASAQNGVLDVPGAVLARTQTPWAMLNDDTYVQERIGADSASDK